jgi:hypothetical protein
VTCLRCPHEVRRFDGYVDWITDCSKATLDDHIDHALEPLGGRWEDINGALLSCLREKAAALGIVPA